MVDKDCHTNGHGSVDQAVAHLAVVLGVEEIAINEAVRSSDSDACVVLVEDDLVNLVDWSFELVLDLQGECVQDVKVLQVYNS